MYKFHKALNQKAFINRVDDKIEFSKYYYEFAPPSAVFKLFNQSGIDNLIAWIRTHNYYEIVVKDPRGSTGKSVYFVKYNPQTGQFQVDGLTLLPVSFCKQYSQDGIMYVQPRLNQHSLINAIAPSALNTIRIITVVNHERQAEVISAVFRITVDSNIDNYSAGNIAAPIDVRTGKVIGPGRKKMAACSPLYYTHPITHKEIIGFEIPLWDLAIDTVKRAALVTPEVRTIGWDLAVLNDHVVIIEGNPSWNKDTPQIPMSKGIKNVLKKYL